MGVVYLATELVTQRVVALKVMRDELADGTSRDRFVREARVAAAIDHPNVVSVLHAGECDGELFIAMQYIDGTDLAAVLAGAPGGLELKRALRLLTDAAAALDAVHARGLVHRDVKPANMLIGRGEPERVYVSDFGLTRLAEGNTRLTSTGQFVGTIAYCAPEQIKGDHVGPAADIYALGCVLFHMLTGRPPFVSESRESMMLAHISKVAPRASSIAPRLAPTFDAVLYRALAKVPSQRYGSAGMLARAARDAADQPPPTQAPLPSPFVRTPRPLEGTSGWRLAISCLVVLMVIGFAIQSPKTGSEVSGSRVATDHVNPRDCLRETPNHHKAQTLIVVSCDAAHTAEVFTRFRVGQPPPDNLWKRCYKSGKKNWKSTNEWRVKYMIADAARSDGEAEHVVVCVGVLDKPDKPVKGEFLFRASSRTAG